MTKKVAFVGPIPPPLGGVAVMNLSFQEIELSNFENVRFNTSNQSQREDLYKNFPWKNIPKEYKKSLKLKRFLREQRPDIVNIFVTSGFSVLRDILFLRVLHRAKTLVVIHFHSKKHGEFALKPKRLKLLGKIFNKYATKVVLLSNDHYAHFSQYFLKEKCVVIENFVDYSLFDNHIHEKTKDFLFVGRLTKEKGFFDLIEALKILKEESIGSNINVGIIGMARNEEMESRIKTILRDEQIESIVTLYGFMEGENKYNLFKEYRYLVFPSHFENSPVVIKEAIAAKMGLIVSNIEANINILNGELNYLSHEAQNPFDLARKMKALINDKSYGLSLCEHSSNIKKYSKEITKEKLLKLYQEILR